VSTAPVTAGPTAAPEPVHLAVWLWLGAVAAGAGEALVRLLLPEPPTLGQLGIRFAIYTGLAALVLALYTGRNNVRWAVAALLGGIGTLSLVVEPVSWLVAGGDPVAFLTTADVPTVLIALLRVLHVAAVLTALALMFRPASTAFFRGG
jgi:hypothetical protein